MPQCNLLVKGLKRQESLPLASGGAGHGALTHQQGAKALLLQAEIYPWSSVHSCSQTTLLKRQAWLIMQRCGVVFKPTRF